MQCWPGCSQHGETQNPISTIPGTVVVSKEDIKTFELINFSKIKVVLRLSIAL